MKWEYKTVNYAKRSFWTSGVNTEGLSETLNKLGSEGWELVDVTSGQAWSGLVLILKRQRG